MLTYAEAINRVQKGIALLNDRGPENWVSKINPDVLDMANWENCILGQVYGTYSQGCTYLEIYDMYSEVDHGFFAGFSWDFDADNIDEDYYVLNQTWRDHINAILNAPKS